jgi:tetratricopeptide (TPR) repeat protein
LDPESPLGYRSLASSYLFNEPLDFILALKNMEKFVSLRPNEPTAHLALGDVHRARLSFDRALNAFGKAIKLDPACGIAFAKIGYIEAYQGLLDKARKDWEMAKSLSKDNSNMDCPNFSVITYLHPGCGKLPADDKANIGLTNIKRKKRFDPLQSPEDDHYFCCTVISMKHGVYVSPFQTMNECRALQREFEKEANAPDPIMISANLIFMESVNSLLVGDFELATKKAGEHARLVEPGKSPKKLQVYNYLMGLIDLKQEHYANAVTHYLNSDLSNACVKYELGLAYDGVGEWEKAQEMFSQVSKCNFATASEPRMVKLSDKWLNLYATIPRDE